MTTSNSGKCLSLHSVNRYIVCVALLVALYLACSVQAQFFTKANSKSIPRMGRRSLLEPGNKLEAYRRALIDRLVDELGPDLMGQLQIGDASGSSGELFVPNDQPFDVNVQPVFEGAGGQSEAQATEGAQISRNERGGSGAGNGRGSSSSSGGDRSITRQNYKGAESLAMRAFNANRLLQHLASGGSPIMSYENLIERKEQQTPAYD